MTSVMIEWLKLTFSRRVNRKRLEALVCFWHKSQYLINLSKVDRLISCPDRFRRFANFLIEKCSKRLCNFRNSISVKKQRLQLKNSVMQSYRALFHSRTGCPNRRIMKMIEVSISLRIRVLLILL